MTIGATVYLTILGICTTLALVMYFLYTTILNRLAIARAKLQRTAYQLQIVDENIPLLGRYIPRTGKARRAYERIVVELAPFPRRWSHRDEVSETILTPLDHMAHELYAQDALREGILVLSWTVLPEKVKAKYRRITQQRHSKWISRENEAELAREELKSEFSDQHPA